MPSNVAGAPARSDGSCMSRRQEWSAVVGACAVSCDGANARGSADELGQGSQLIDEGTSVAHGTIGNSSWPPDIVS